MNFEYVKKTAKDVTVEVGDVILLNIDDEFKYPFLVVEVARPDGGYSTVYLSDNEVDGLVYDTIEEMIDSEFPNFDEECEVYTVDKMVLKEK